MTCPADPFEKGFRLAVDVDPDGEEVVLDQPARAAREVRELPFCIAVLGDFSGRGMADRAEGSAPEFRPLRVTPDNMVELAGLAPRLELRLSDAADRPLDIRFQALADLHPDHLLRRLPLFTELREARAAAVEGRESGFAVEPEAPEHPAASSEALDETSAAGRQGSADEGVPGATDAPRAGGHGGGEGEDGLLDAVLEQTRPPSASDGSSRARSRPESGSGGRVDAELREFVRKIVEPHRIRPGPDRSAEIAAIDRASGVLMRAVMHHERFRALEALWRSVVFLLSRIDTTGKVRVYLVDAARQELQRDLAEAPDPTRSGLHGLLSEPELGFPGGRWAVAVGAYSFGAGADGDPGGAELLDRVALAARSAGVPWISGADPRLAGCASWAASPDPGEWAPPWPGPWRRLRRSPQARWVGLALPRFLAREPYGADSARRCRSFSFEELPGAEEEGAALDRSRRLLWGNPAFPCAAVLARAFARDGWGFSPAARPDLGQVPLAPPAASDGPDPTLTEHRLDRTAARRLAETGFMPVVAFPGEARIRIGGIRSVADPTSELAAWWARR